MKERILCSAILFDDGKHYDHQPDNINSGFVVCGRRHHNCFTTLAILKGIYGRLQFKQPIQGFLTSTNRFLNRNEAARIAFEAGQIINWVENDKWSDVDWKEVQLFSEDLY